MQPVKVISFYTENTPYEQEVIDLKQSCENFGLDLEAARLPSKGSWEANVAMKPSFILEKLKTTDVPLLWVDADSAFLQKPDFTQFAGVDFSVRFMQVFREDPRHALNAATLFINKTEAAKKLVEMWVKRSNELCANGPVAFVDQIALFDVLLLNKEAKVLPLPVSYCKIFDQDQFFIDDDQVVIEQRQASRRTRCDTSSFS